MRSWIRVEPWVQGILGPTGRGLHAHVFPESLFHCAAGFHLAGAEVLAAFEQLGLSLAAFKAPTVV